MAWCMVKSTFQAIRRARALSLNSHCQSHLTVTTSLGKLRGSFVPDSMCGSYYKFQGIPYAKPPLGELRFKAPEPPEKWEGVLDATREGNPCYSRHTFNKHKIVGCENCLFLNIYTKKILSDDLRPVLFWIHGGAFVFGCGGTELYGPDFLLTENVVVVTINYRLGIFGFLCLEDASLGVPGNAGLKDMVMALKWVQNNISQFGGDPSNVTIFGQSAGAAAVHLLVLSEMGTGLFHKAIAQSGCAFNSWTRGTRGVKEIVPLLNLGNADEKMIYNHLTKLSAAQLHDLQEEVVTFQTLSSNTHRPFGYVVDTTFLNSEPGDIIKHGKFNHVPFMIGYNSSETTCLDLLRKSKWPGAETLEDKIHFDWGYEIGSVESLAVADEIRRFYFGDRKLSDIKMEERVLLSSDVFIYGIYKTVFSQYPKSKSPLYFYRMSVETKLNIMRQIYNVQIPGAVHGDELGYLFKHFATPEVSLGSIEDVMMRRIVRLWTNFAKYGNPTPKEDGLLGVEWKPVTNDELDYLEIGSTLIALRNPSDRKRIDFLKSLYDRSPAALAQKCSSW